MTVWIVVQIGYYDGEELVSVHAREMSANAEAARLTHEQDASVRQSWPSPGPYRVVVKEVLP